MSAPQSFGGGATFTPPPPKDNRNLIIIGLAALALIFGGLFTWNLIKSGGSDDMISKLEQELAERDSVIEQNEQAISDQTASYERAQRELADLSAKYNQDKVKWGDDYRAARRKYEGLQAQVEKLLKEKEFAIKERDQVIAENQKLIAENQTLRNKVEMLERLVAERDQKISELQENNRRLEEENNRLKCKYEGVGCGDVKPGPSTGGGEYGDRPISNVKVFAIKKNGNPFKDGHIPKRADYLVYRVFTSGQAIKVKVVITSEENKNNQVDAFTVDCRSAQTDSKRNKGDLTTGKYNVTVYYEDRADKPIYTTSFRVSAL